MENIYLFIILFDKTNIAQADFVLSFNIFKSYLFNKSIPMLNQNDTYNIFVDNFLDRTNEFEDTIILSSKSNSFLDKEYSKRFNKYLYGDYIELLEKEYYEKNKMLLAGKSKNGIKPVIIRFFEIINYYSLKFCIYYSSEISNNKMSLILSEREFKIYEINVMLESIIRVWYNRMLKMLINYFYQYLNQCKVIYIVLFICVIVVVIIYYFIIWKIYEEKLNSLLKGSFDLINLIPQEIKNVIIEKLNE